MPMMYTPQVVAVVVLLLAFTPRDVSAVISIDGPVYIENGQPLELMCTASGTEYRPRHIDWFKDGSKLTTTIPNERVRINSAAHTTSNDIYSRLTIPAVAMSDSGTYICRSSDLQIVSHLVQVLNTDFGSHRSGPSDENPTVRETEGVMA